MIVLTRDHHHSIAGHNRRSMSGADPDLPSFLERFGPLGGQRRVDGTIALRAAPLRPLLMCAQVRPFDKLRAAPSEVEGREPGAGKCAPALVTTVGKRGHWVVPEAPEESRLINPGKPEASAIIRRVKSRRPSSQMPPLGSVVVDKRGLDVLTAWVNSNPDEWKEIVARCVAGAS